MKLDKINNRNRQIKAPLSIHKTFDYVVYPINPESFELPLVEYQTINDNQVNEVIRGLKHFIEDEPDNDDRKGFIKTIKPFIEEARKEIRDKKK